MNIKTLFLLITLCISINAMAEVTLRDTTMPKPELDWSIGNYNEMGGDLSGLELSISTRLTEHFGTRASGVFYQGKNQADAIDEFTGFSISGYYVFGSKNVAPHLGVGVFIADSLFCDDEEDADGECDQNTVVGIYPEIGVKFKVSRFHIYPFVRRYFDTNSPVDNLNTFGLHIGATF